MFRRLGLVLLVLALACHRRAKLPDEPSAQEVLAQIDEESLTRDNWSGFLEYETLGKVSARDASLELKQQVLRKLVVLELLVREARRVGFEARHQYPADGGPSVYAKKEWLANGLLQETSFPAIPPATEPERRSYYDAHHAEFTISERIRVSVVVVADEATAARVREDKRMLLGASSPDYIALVNEYCVDDLIKSHGGELGWVLKIDNHGWQPKELIDDASRLENVGDLSQPTKVAQGWAIFRLSDHDAARLLAYDVVKDDVGNSVKMRKFAQQTEDFIQQLRNKATITTYEDKLRE